MILLVGIVSCSVLACQQHVRAEELWGFIAALRVAKLRRHVSHLDSITSPMPYGLRLFQRVQGCISPFGFDTIPELNLNPSGPCACRMMRQPTNGQSIEHNPYYTTRMSVVHYMLIPLHFSVLNFD